MEIALIYLSGLLVTYIFLLLTKRRDDSIMLQDLVYMTCFALVSWVGLLLICAIYLYLWFDEHRFKVIWRKRDE